MKPFLKSNKNDYLDAEAFAEAVQRRSMRRIDTAFDQIVFYVHEQYRQIYADCGLPLRCMLALVLCLVF